jgi:hypothetical protein
MAVDFRNIYGQNRTISVHLAEQAAGKGLIESALEITTKSLFRLARCLGFHKIESDHDPSMVNIY